MRLFKKKIPFAFLVAAALLVALIATLIVCFITLDMAPVFNYRVLVYNSGEQAISVKMTVSVPLFSKRDNVYLFLGDKDITVRSCTNFWGGEKETFLSDDGIVTIPVSRGSRTTMVYDVNVAAPGKHGARGAVTNDFAVFDGDQAFLLPAEFTIYFEEGVKKAVSRIKIDFDFPKEWIGIVPFKRLDKPDWMDIYAITKNAFVFGNFEQVPGTADGLAVFALPGQSPGDASGFESLFAYFSDLFGSSPPELNVVLLPHDDPYGPIIGGSGTVNIASSFDQNSLRDWQLLSHRMFHAFYDIAAPYMNVHVAPNIWLNEGLVTYYENLATGALPEPLKERLGVDTDRHFALTFNQYLYMRLKEPFVYNFAPMEEELLTSAAMTEFLHYTAAPLIVKFFEDESVSLGNPPNALLRYCLDESAFEDTYTAIAAALDLLGDKGEDFCKNYMLGMDMPPLWYLKDYQPSSAEVLESLNYIEILLANWHQTENMDYPADLVSEQELREAMDASGSGRIPVLSYDLNASIREYCPELFALIKDYYRRASEQGFDLNDRDLRFKMLGN